MGEWQQMPPKTTLDDIQLEDRFERDSERLLLTGDQVLARILLTSLTPTLNLWKMRSTTP